MSRYHCTLPNSIHIVQSRQLDQSRGQGPRLWMQPAETWPHGPRIWMQFFFQSWEPLLWRDVVNKLYCRFSKTQRVIVKFIMKFRKSVTFISFHYKTFKLFWVNLKKNSKQDRIWDPDPTFGMQLWICFRFIFKKKSKQDRMWGQGPGFCPVLKFF